MFLFFASALLSGSIGNLPLENGKVLEDCRLGYRTFGEMNSGKSNVVLFPSWFNGTTENLVRFIGPGGLVDSSKYYVIAVDALGNGVSTSPSNSRTQKGTKFPKITIGDMVAAEHKLVTGLLGIDHLHAVMGVSMGGMQTFQWMVSHPEFMDRAVSIVGTPKMGSKEIFLWLTVAEQMKLGGGQPKSGLLGMLPGLVSPAAFASDEQRKQVSEMLAGGGAAAADSGGGGGGLSSLPLNKNPEDVWKQFEAMLAHDVSKPFGKSMDKAAAAVKAKVMVIVATQDQAVSPDQPLHFADLLKAPVLKLTGACGHKAYDCEKDKIAPEVDKFLGQ